MPLKPCPFCAIPMPSSLPEAYFRFCKKCCLLLFLLKMVSPPYRNLWGPWAWAESSRSHGSLTPWLVRLGGGVGSKCSSGRLPEGRGGGEGGSALWWGMVGEEEEAEGTGSVGLSWGAAWEAMAAAGGSGSRRVQRPLRPELEAVVSQLEAMEGGRGLCSSLRLSIINPFVC